MGLEKVNRNSETGLFPAGRWPRERPVLIGVVHLAPLPGSPRFGGSMAEVCRRAVADAAAWAEGGADAVLVENFGDVPFFRGPVAPAAVAAMAVAAGAIRAEAGDLLPLGFNVLRNDARAALGLWAAAADGRR